MPSKQEDEDIAPNPRQDSIKREPVTPKEKLQDANVPALTFVGQQPVPVFDIWDEDVFNSKTDQDANGEDEAAFKSVNWGTAENKYIDHGNAPIILPQDNRDVSESVGEDDSESKSDVAVIWKCLDDPDLGALPYWESRKRTTENQVENPEEIPKEETNDDATKTEVESTEAKPEFFVVRPPKDTAESAVSVGESAGEEEATETKRNTRFAIPQKIDSNISEGQDVHIALTRQAKIMESVFYMVQSMSLLAREKVERQIKDKEAAELERLEKSKEGEDGSAPVEENEEEPTEEEIAAKRAEEAEKLRQKTQLIKDNDIIPEGAYLWESIYPKGEDGLPKYNPGGRYAVRLFVNGAWRRVDVDDSMPTSSDTGAPLLCRSTDCKEMWPLILAKALTVVVRGNWDDYDALKLLHHLTGLVAIPQDIYSDTAGWPLLVNAIPHTKIQYEDEAVESPRSPRLFDDDEEMEAQLAAEKLEEEAALALAGPEDPTEEEEKEIPIENVEQKPNCIYVLVGSNSASIEIEPADNEEYDGGVPEDEETVFPTINAKCGYVCMETRGGDDDANIAGLISDDPEIVAAAQKAIAAAKLEDEEDFPDDREVRFCTGIKENSELQNGWMNIGQIAKEFSNRTFMLINPNDASFFSMRQEISKHWRWSWEDESSADAVENEDKADDAEGLSDENIPAQNITVPENPGLWSPRSTEWVGTEYLHFFNKKVTVVEGEDENVAVESTDNAPINVLPYMRVWVTLSADHIARSSKPSSIAIRSWSPNAPIGPVLLYMSTTTIATGYFDLPSLEDDGAIYEVVTDTVLGCHVNISCKCDVEKYDFQALNRTVLKNTVTAVSGKTNASHANSWQVLKRCQFLTAQSCGEDGETRNEDLKLSCHVWCKNPFLRRYLTVYTMNNDTREVKRSPLLMFNNSNMAANESGYTIFVMCLSGAHPLPSFEWELSLISKTDLLDFKEVPVHSIQDFASNYIPNKYFRLFRDVVDILPGEEEADNTNIGSVRLTLSDPGAYAMLRVINPVTNATLFEKSGRGVVDLLDVPLSSAVAEEAGENENNGKVILESVLLPNLFYIDKQLQSRRPYHYPSGQPGDDQVSSFAWNLRVVCGGNGIALNRDLNQEQVDARIRSAWEEAQEGRAVLAKASRSYYLHTSITDSANIVDSSKENEAKTEEEENAVEVDGLDGLGEEERELELARRKRLSEAVGERVELSKPVLVKLNASVKATILNEDKINDLCTTWQAEAEKAAELLPNMTSTIESTRNAFDAYKTERLTGMKTNIVDKFSNDIAAARASYAINAESKDQ